MQLHALVHQCKQPMQMERDISSMHVHNGMIDGMHDKEGSDVIEKDKNRRKR
jgi:hypothetical protein